MRKALVTGVTGQDGYYIAKTLLNKGYTVAGLVRDTKETILDGLTLIEGDLTDGASIYSAIDTFRPDEVYNMAGMTSVGPSWRKPYLLASVNVLGPLHLLEAIRKYKPDTRFLQACSCEMFGRQMAPQSEETPFAPENPYAVSKIAAFQFVRGYRESYNLYAASVILFPHESPRRSTEFFTQKVIKGISNIGNSATAGLTLGSLKSVRDWGYAPEYAEVMTQILQLPDPTDFVLGSGQGHKIEDFVDIVCKLSKVKKSKLKIDEEFKPTDNYNHVADTSKIQRLLGWSPVYDLKKIATEMWFAENDF